MPDYIIRFETSGIPGDIHPTYFQAIRADNSDRYEGNVEELSIPRFPVDPETSIIVFDGEITMACWIKLGWPKPGHIIDLWIEMRARTNGLIKAKELSFEKCIELFDLEFPRGGPDSLGGLYALQDIWWHLRLRGHELFLAQQRGENLWDTAVIVNTGVPVDVDMIHRFEQHWSSAKSRLIRSVDREYGVFLGHYLSPEQFVKYLKHNNLRWPVDDDGSLKLDLDSMKDMARGNAKLRKLYQLLRGLKQIRPLKIRIGSDGCNRCRLHPYWTQTGRFQFLNAESVFSLPSSMRGFISPKPGHVIIYLDFEAEEIGVAAALSGDSSMMADYDNGDPYLGMGIRGGLLPDTATAESHPEDRLRLKPPILAILYGIGEDSLSVRMNEPPCYARELIDLHKKVFSRYWQWGDEIENIARYDGILHTLRGWPLYVTREMSPQAIRNHPVQANAAEIMRLSCRMAIERGVEICVPVHDALLVSGPQEEEEAIIEVATSAMIDASADILDGFRLRVGVEQRVHHGEHYKDKRANGIWTDVWEVINDEAYGR